MLSRWGRSLERSEIVEELIDVILPLYPSESGLNEKTVDIVLI